MGEVLQHLWSGFLRVVDAMLDTIESGTDFPEFQRVLRRELDRLGSEATRIVLEQADKRLRERANERPGWVIAQRENEKSLLTCFGPVRYRRTNFKHKTLKCHKHLVDEQFGIVPHQKIDDSLRAQLVNNAVTQSYRSSGSWSEEQLWSVSGQTVMNSIRSMDTQHPPPKDLGKEKRVVPVLFIQADEDHVANQEQGGRWQPRLVTIHEGVQGSEKRRQLINPTHIGGLYARSTEQLWTKVWDYLDATYDLEQVSTILLSGDGASWIRYGCEVIPGAVFVLDRFHAEKAVVKACGGDRELQRRMWESLHNTDRQGLQAVIRDALRSAEKPSRIEAIKEVATYLRRQWDGIAAWRTYSGIWPGCSAEGQISHIYAARLSSRPLAWSRRGVDQMSRLRVMKANGKCVQAEYLKQKRNGSRIKVTEAWIREVRKNIASQSRLEAAMEANMPALEGRRTQLTRALRALSKTKAF